MSRMQIRPKGAGEDAVFYCPQRDIAYCYAPFMKEALQGLRPPFWPEGMQEVSEKLGATEADMLEGVKALMRAHLQFTNVPDIPDAATALRNAGWFDLPPVVRVMIYYRMGEVLLGGFFVALRDVSKMGEVSPQGADIADFVGMGRLVAEQMSGERRELSHFNKQTQELYAAQAMIELQDTAAIAKQKMLEGALTHQRKLEAEINRLAQVLKDTTANNVGVHETQRQIIAAQSSRILELESQTLWQFCKSRLSRWRSGRTHSD